VAMTRRAIGLGLGLGLLISLLTYFNDFVIGQTHLIGNFLPIAVFGSVALLLLGLNPLLSLLGQRAPLGAGEVAIVAALGLAACGWPASNFYRYLTPITAMPAHWLKTTTGWQSAHVMSYVPGASAELGDGHLLDATRLVAELQAASHGEAPTPARQLWLALSDSGRRLIGEASAATHVSPSQAQALVRVLDQALSRPELYDARAFAAVRLGPELAELLAERELAPHELVLRNRLLLAAAFPEQIAPPPRGQGALVDGGRADPLVVDTLLQGRQPDDRLSLVELPWNAWWPTLRLWGGAAFLLALSSLCLSLIVHPQWSKRELLPYPIARFIAELGERSPGRRVPDVARSKLFWIAFSVIAFWHLVNGLHAWFPAVPEIPRKFDFTTLTAIFPNAARVSGGYGWFTPTIYFGVIAFCLFMPSAVSFSLGISHILFFVLGAALIVNGVQLSSTVSGASATALLKFGGYVGATLIIAYTGRRYYATLALRALGRSRSEAPPEAVWALRALCVCTALAVLLLHTSGLGWAFSSLFVLACLMMYLVVTRIVAESGNFFVQVEWGIAAVLTGLLGFEAVGPSAFILLGIATEVIVPDLREAFMPYLSHGLKLAEGVAHVPPARITRWLVLMLVLGFVTAGVVTFYLQYNYSVIQVGDEWATHRKPRLAFDVLTNLISAARSQGTLVAAASHGTSLDLELFQPVKGAWFWSSLGLALVLGVSAARLSLPWWPLHPVAFLVWDTYAVIVFGPSFLLGWLLKVCIVGLGGARAYHAVKPAMLGVISAELVSGLFWVAVGVIYYFATGQRPATYSIMPS
jgi:uncharacterized protein DUF6785/uncharacterized protein DUF6784